MSEVGDACQIIIISGRMIGAAGTLSLKAALLAMKVYNTLYLGKWKGSTSLHRFRAIKGDDYEFINICSEVPEKLFAIEKEMEAHNLLFARLPDLCGGDGNTQYVIARNDMHIFAAFLMDHTHGNYKEIKVGPIKESDYMQTSVHPENGEHTTEFEDLNREAKEEYPKMLLLEDKAEKEKKKVFLLPQKVGRKEEKSPEEPQEKSRDIQQEKLQIKTKETENTWSEQLSPGKIFLTQYGQRRELPVTALMTVPQIRVREEQIRQPGQMELIYDEPLKETEQWAMFPLHDGDHVVVVPKADLLRGDTAREQRHLAVPIEKPPAAMLFTGRNYVVLDLRNGTHQISPGKDVIGLLQKPSLLTRKEELNNLSRNIEKNIGAGAILPSADRKRGGR